MIYTVRDVLEDIDFGCEERPEGAPVLAVAILEGDDGSITHLKVPDRMLQEWEIEKGTRVSLDESGFLKKIL